MAFRFHTPRPGRFIHPMGSAGNVLAVLDTLYATPMWGLDGGIKVDQIGFRLTGVPVGSNFRARLAVYRDRNGLPGELLVDTGVVSYTPALEGKVFPLDKPLVLDAPTWLLSSFQGPNTTMPVVAASLNTSAFMQTAVLGVDSMGAIPNGTAAQRAGLTAPYAFDLGMPLDAENLPWVYQGSASGILPTIGFRVAA